jgi:hypothetical protein
MPTVLLLLCEGDARKGKQSPKADKDRKFNTEPHFAGRKSLL